MIATQSETNSKQHTATFSLLLICFSTLLIIFCFLVFAKRKTRRRKKLFNFSSSREKKISGSRKIYFCFSCSFTHFFLFFAFLRLATWMSSGKFINSTRRNYFWWRRASADRKVKMSSIFSDMWASSAFIFRRRAYQLTCAPEIDVLSVTGFHRSPKSVSGYKFLNVER